MSEDETFLRLKRTPIEQLAKITGAMLGISDEIVIMRAWADSYEIREQNGPDLEFLNIYKQHGWEFDELCKAAYEYYK